VSRVVVASFAFSVFAICHATILRCAWAQERSASDFAEGRESPNQGLTLRNKGDLPGALEKLKAAHALANTPITGLELGQTHVSLGQLVEAEEVFLSVARIPVRREETARSAAARRESASLAEQARPRIPSLTIRIRAAMPANVAASSGCWTKPTSTSVVCSNRLDFLCRLSRGEKSLMKLNNVIIDFDIPQRRHS
jgi:hypothetical protein